MAEKNYIYIETYGCAANQNNSEIISGILTSSGYKMTNNEDIASIIIINSCVVKGKTENKTIRRIQDITKDNPKKLLIIAGCITETNAMQIKKIAPSIILLGTHHIKEIVKLIKDYEENKLGKEKQEEYLSEQNEEKLLSPKIPSNKLISITQISEGCDGFCTYCKTRMAKGKLFSYPKEDILKSIKSDLQNGAKEIWITSQDNANYGMDKFGRELPLLLNEILKLKHKFKLRLGMMDPNNVLPIIDELIEIYKNPKMYKFLHIPLQSASNSVLKSMNRLYKIEQAQKIIDKFKLAFPDIVIATDIIVGYPSERDIDYKETLEFVKKNKFDVFNLSKMSIHKGTPASKLLPLDPKIIHTRTSELMEVHRQTALENKNKFLNKKINVFVNKRLGGNLFEARDENYNIVLLNTEKKVLGKTIDVKVKNLGIHHMIGEIII
jgi:MiaB-like tRNA modifying enzyme